MNALAAEFTKISRDLDRMLAQSSLGDETPLRIHTSATDDGHGLGGPQFAPEFLRWIAQVCECDRRPVCAPGCRTMRDRGRHLPDCDPGCPRLHFRPSSHRNDSHRLKRALRQLRSIAPAEFDIAYLILGQGMSYTETQGRINNSRYMRGQPPYSEGDFMVLVVAGMSKVVAAY